ncbi:virion protein [Clitoria yellow vein virus]|uniref:Capsid protein n=1 Tax=Clitoria yellow vein virus TaxID=12157 RepID=O89510_9VIRU|nr:virion protein [Clitoria yellow vein virus]AAC25012.1 virion protein [Clitoria yellow vein virus]
MSTDVIVSAQPLINTKASEIPLQPGSPPPSITYPFQITIASLGVAATSDAVSISAQSSLASFTSLYRHAILQDLHATIHPSASAPAFPTSVALAWVPYNSTATASEILNVYGGQEFCIGGAINSSKPIIIPCPLTNINPVIKDSVTYLDTPKLLVYSTAPAYSTSPTCTLTITGKVKLHSPLLSSSS